MIRGRAGEEEGQIIPALLLVVVVILFLGLLFVQVGSAAEQKTQTQTAADSGAVAAGHKLRDANIPLAAVTMIGVYPKIGATLFSGLPNVDPRLADAACSAVQRNWLSNPHGGARIDCTDVSTYPSGGASLVRGVTVDVTAPKGQVVDGPADVKDEQAKAGATARVTLDQCPRVISTPAAQAVGNWVADQTVRMMGGAVSHCFTPADATTLATIEADFTGASLTVLGPSKPIFLGVSRGMRVELVDD